MAAPKAIAWSDAYADGPKYNPKTIAQIAEIIGIHPKHADQLADRIRAIGDEAAFYKTWQGRPTAPQQAAAIDRIAAAIGVLVDAIEEADDASLAALHAASETIDPPPQWTSGRGRWWDSGSDRLRILMESLAGLSMATATAKEVIGGEGRPSKGRPPHQSARLILDYTEDLFKEFAPPRKRFTHGAPKVTTAELGQVYGLLARPVLGDRYPAMTAELKKRATV